jgi:Zn finger protein HypA/HybF involved in hydrogenase expression
MGVSRATFGRILHQARQTVADALINGKAIKIDGGNYKMVEEKRRFSCRKCRHCWEEPLGTGRPKCCPGCGCDDFYRYLSQNTAKQRD